MTDIETTKATLRDLLLSTDQGRQITLDQKTCIFEWVERLEQLNPSPTPTADPGLSGTWRMMFTTSQSLLRLGQSVPAVTTGEIYQAIRTETCEVVNIAEIKGSGPLAFLVPQGIFAVKASFTVESEKRVNVTFRRYLVGSQMMMNYEVSSFLTLFYQDPDQIPALKIEIPQGQQAGWLDITYLDETLRIGRGNAGSLFILEKC